MSIRKKRILLLLPEGTTIRNFLTTNIIQHILDNSNAEVVCAVNNPSRYSSLFVDPRVTYVDFYRRRSLSFQTLLLSIIRSRFLSINENKSLEIFRRSLPYYKTENLLRQPFPKSKIILKFFEKIQKIFFFHLKQVERQINEINPDLIFSTHLIKRDEYDYLMIAKSNNIPTLGMVKSFDNVTGKGHFAFKPESVIVWNKIMEKELVDLYGYKKENIVITGVPQFDLYKEDPQISRKEFFENINLDPNKKTILYATNSEFLGVDDFFNVEFIQSNLNDMNAQLIVRVHFGDNLNRYSKTDFKNVYFQVPGIEEGLSSNERVAHKNFISELRDTLFFSDVTINTASTMTLDAIACGKPVINIFFDWEKREYLKSVKRFYDLIHYEPIVRFNKKNMANSKEDLIHLIRHSLNSPNADREVRRNIEDLMLAGNLSDASQQIASCVIDKAVSKSER